MNNRLRVPPIINVNLSINPDWAKLPLFDRKGWTRVHLGDVVHMLKEQVDPVADGIERYVAGEHMETENIHIRHWGNVGDGYLGPAFIRRFRKGQVLYGSRRTYLKKVAVADWDGVTANTTFVLETVAGKLRQELLPWLMLSQRFTEHSVRESKGSTNPYINFPDVAKFEFDLPPLYQQCRIAEILWAVDEVIQQTLATEDAAQSLADANLAHFLYNAQKWPERDCRDIMMGGPRNGFSPPANAAGSGLPTLSISAIRGGEVITGGSVKFASVTLSDVVQFQLQPGDILVVRGNGNRLLCGKAGIVRHYPEGCFYPDLLIRLRFKPDMMLQEFAVMQWNEPRTHVRLISKAKSTNGIWKINGKDIQSHRLVVPPISAQERFLGAIQPMHELVRRLKDSLVKGLDLREQLLNSIFGA